MPELPEVETTVRQLRRKVLQRTVVNVWTDCKQLIKKPKAFNDFKKQIQGKTIQDIQRRGKIIILELSKGLSLLVHQKMTGHLLYGQWQEQDGEWQAQARGPLQSDSKNRFLHFILFLDNGWQLALSDLRKFARIELWKTKSLWESDEMRKLGPDALSPQLTLAKFKRQLSNRRIAIKKILMDQTVIAGIGNIYSDEILFKARVHPKKSVAKLSDKEVKAIYQAIKIVLKKALKMKGTSIADYRTPQGKKGGFGPQLKVYQREGEKCPNCNTKIKSIKINNRSAHFCPKCQDL